MKSEKVPWLGIPAIMFAVACMFPIGFPGNSISGYYFLITFGIAALFTLGSIKQFLANGSVPQSPDNEWFLARLSFGMAIIAFLFSFIAPNFIPVVLALGGIALPRWWLRNKFEWTENRAVKVNVLLFPLSLVALASVVQLTVPAIWSGFSAYFTHYFILWSGALVMVNLLMIILTVSVPGLNQALQREKEELPAPAEEVLQQVSKFRWAKPQESLAIVQSLQSNPDSSVIWVLSRMKTSLEMVKANSKKTLYMAQLKLVSEIDHQIEERVQRNKALGNIPRHNFCPNCRTRAQRFHIGQIAITVCPQCHLDTQLVRGASLIIGTMGTTATESTPNGLFLLNIWDPSSRSLLPDTVDGFWIPKANSPEVEHYLAAVLTYVDNHQKINRTAYPIYAEDLDSMSENSQRLIANARKGGAIKLFNGTNQLAQTLQP